MLEPFHDEVSTSVCVAGADSECDTAGKSVEKKVNNS